MAHNSETFNTGQQIPESSSLSTRLHSFRLEPEPIQRGIQAVSHSLIETGNLPGAPAAHKRLADIVEYTQAIINSTSTVAEAITPQDLKYFAWGLPIFADHRPKNSELDTKDIQNLITLNNCMPKADANIGNYHVSATMHTGKLVLIGALNPRAIEWMLLAAIMVQRGLERQVTDLLVGRKDRFLEIMHKDLSSDDDNAGIDRAIIAFDATLDRVIVNVVTSLKGLELGALGGELTFQGDLPDHLDLDHYVTADPVIFSIAKEAELIGCQFHDEVLFIEEGTAIKPNPNKRVRPRVSSLVPAQPNHRLRRIEILQNAPGQSQYHICNQGPTGRVPHGKLVSGLLDQLLNSSRLPAAQRERFLTALKEPSTISFNLEVDLESGIAEILVDEPTPKGVVECPGLSIETDMPEPASLGGLADMPSLAQVRTKDTAFLKFDHVAVGNSAHWEQIVTVYLIVRGWWWSKHLVRDLPHLLYVPHHRAYFAAMACIGTTMLHLEQNSECEITSNHLFDVLRLLTNLGGDHDAMTQEAAVYAAQGPGGTLVHDVLGEHHHGWPQNYALAYRWLRGKFFGVPEVATFAHGCSFRKTMPIPTAIATGDPARQPGAGTSVTIFADSTDGHTLSCAVVTRARKIRTLPFVRVLCGLLTAYVGSELSCDHTQADVEAFLKKGNLHPLPWSVMEDSYFGRAELRDEDTVVVTGVEEEKLCQVMALAVLKEGSAVDACGCVLCALEWSNHVVQARRKRM